MFAISLFDSQSSLAGAAENAIQLDLHATGPSPPRPLVGAFSSSSAAGPRLAGRRAARWQGGVRGEQGSSRVGGSGAAVGVGGVWDGSHVNLTRPTHERDRSDGSTPANQFLDACVPRREPGVRVARHPRVSDGITRRARLQTCREQPRSGRRGRAGIHREVGAWRTRLFPKREVRRPAALHRLVRPPGRAHPD